MVLICEIHHDNYRKPEAIADAIMIELDRGVTFLYGQGAYTKIIVKLFM